MEVEAVTATGRSQLIERGGEFDRWAELLVRSAPVPEVVCEGRRRARCFGSTSCDFCTSCGFRRFANGSRPSTPDPSRRARAVRRADCRRQDGQTGTTRAGRLQRAAGILPDDLGLRVLSARREAHRRRFAWSSVASRWTRCGGKRSGTQHCGSARPFSPSRCPTRLRETIADGLRGLDASKSLAVRSSAVGEDSAGRSFAGLHESIIGVRGNAPSKMRSVWCGHRYGPTRPCSIARNWGSIRRAAAWPCSSRR